MTGYTEMWNVIHSFGLNDVETNNRGTTKMNRGQKDFTTFFARFFNNIHFDFYMRKRLLFPALLLISIPVFAQFKVRFIVQEATAQKHDSIYIAGYIATNYTNWHNDTLKALDATHKTSTLDLSAGTYEFKFFRLNRSIIEEKNGACARVHRIYSITADTTIHVLVKNWSDDCSVNIFSGDQWYLLRTDSVSALAELVLSLVILIYLLSIRKKSTDGRLITRYMFIMTIFYLVGFLRNINETPWKLNIAEDVASGWVVIFHVWFSYNYRKPFSRKEMFAVLTLLIILINTILLLEIENHSSQFSFVVLWSIFIFAYLWSIVVLLRKAGPRSYTQTRETQLANKDNKAFRSFAWWSSLFVVLWLNYIIPEVGIKLYFTSFLQILLIYHVLSLISIPWFAFIYVNHAEEYTTFQVKLVGIMLCLTLLLLGILGFIILPTGYISQTAEGKPVQDAVNILAMLVPVMTLLIVLLFRVFVKKNLLRPLREVLDGVQRVNAGDLSVEVPVEVRDELGFLSHNFNQMTNSLRHYSENMETLVADRTIALEQKSTQLEKQKAALQTALEDLKATQAQLIQSEKMASLGELTAGIAHEIQNPLNFVNNFSDVNKELAEELEEELDKGNYEDAQAIVKDLKENEERINHHGKRADAIVKGMLQHSRSSSGQKEPTDINALVDEYLRLAYHGMQAKDKTFNVITRTEFDNSIGQINVIPQDIGRVILNLINNAFYAVSEKQKENLNGYEPTVIASTVKGNGKVEIKVRDNGKGISQKILDKIFQPFFTTKPTGQGTGLGLSLSYDIIKVHGGEIKVETKEGIFTEFMIILPS
jgi:signal transduction histidine kinase